MTNIGKILAYAAVMFVVVVGTSNAVMAQFIPPPPPPPPPPVVSPTPVVTPPVVSPTPVATPPVVSPTPAVASPAPAPSTPAPDSGATQAKQDPAPGGRTKYGNAVLSAVIGIGGHLMVSQTPKKHRAHNTRLWDGGHFVGALLNPAGGVIGGAGALVLFGRPSGIVTKSVRSGGWRCQLEDADLVSGCRAFLARHGSRKVRRALRRMPVDSNAQLALRAWENR